MCEPVPELRLRREYIGHKLGGVHRVNEVKAPEEQSLVVEYGRGSPLHLSEGRLVYFRRRVGAIV